MIRVQPRRAFTLIELLVVVAIIALLISILLPSLSRAREQARTVKCAANLRQFAFADIMYADEYDGWYVPINSDYGNVSSGPAYRWQNNPDFQKMIGVDPSAGSSGWPTGLMCPSGEDEEISAGEVVRIYGHNGCWVRPSPLETDGIWGLRRQGILQPQASVMWADSNINQIDPFSTNYQVQWDVYGERGPGPDGGSHSIAHRHNEGMNGAYYDGHVSYSAKEDTHYSGNLGDEAWEIMWMPYGGGEAFNGGYDRGPAG